MPTQSFYPFVEGSQEEWLAQIKHDLKGKVAVDSLNSQLWEDIQIQPFYSFEQLTDLAQPVNFNPPSKFPGLSPRIWSTVVSPTIKDPKSTNEEILEALNLGAEGLVLELDGTEDLNHILKGVFTEFIQLYFLPKAGINPVLIQVKNWVKSLQLTPEMLHGSILWSPTGAMFEGESNLKVQIELGMTLISEFKDFPEFYPMTIDLARYANAGGSGIQELSFGVGELIELLDHFSRKGLSVNQAISQMAFHSAVGENHFPELVKLKVLRTFLVDLIHNLGGSISPEGIHLIASTSLWNKSYLDQNTSLIRQTYEAMAAVLGGCNTLWIRDLDQKEPNKLRKRIARNISTILREEAFLDKVMDPASGAYFMEVLGKALEENLLSQLEEIEKKGGWAACFADRSIHQQIRNRAKQTQEALLANTKSMIGVNKYELKNELVLDFGLENVPAKEYELRADRASYLVEMEKIAKK